MSKRIEGRQDELKPGMLVKVPEALEGEYLVGHICSTTCIYGSTTLYKLGGVPAEHTCGVIDDRESGALVHLILAEIRKSNAPAWVAEELEKKIGCQRCSLRTLASATDRERPAHLELSLRHEGDHPPSEGGHKATSS